MPEKAEISSGPNRVWLTVWLMMVGGVGWSASVGIMWDEVGYTQTISLKQGNLKGVIIAPRDPSLRKIEVFLGIPYAAAPVGSRRFMPPGTPEPWTKLKYANETGPVCPQVLPRLDEGPNKIPAGRHTYLKRLLPFLKVQSEDCLYLNIYAPVDDSPLGTKFSVIVFIHGESFQWNSGNPYDGTTLSSYAGVIFVTINFRLGILGFLKPGTDSHTPSNFGLLDQIAALQWVKDNIAHFGGDPTSVTLLGHHTGAVAVNYLMLSPVAQADNGLFHSAILMSGSALADWAVVKYPDQATLQVADHLGCPTASDHLAECLRQKRVSDLLKVPLNPNQLGPSIDGNVVPNKAKDLMTKFTDLFSRYNLLCGVTEAESLHMLDGVSLSHGMLDEERDKLLKEYFRNTFQVYPHVAQTKAIQEYHREERGKSGAENTRDATVELLSDATIVAPVFQTAIYHSTPRAKNVTTYAYVFSHRSAQSDFPNVEKSVYGEELPFVLGIPIGGPKYHFVKNYNEDEKFLSEKIMTQWSNFAKTGDPNFPIKHRYMSKRKEWGWYDTKRDGFEWPMFDPVRQAYYDIKIYPTVDYKYRYKFVEFWNTLPSYLTNQRLPNFPPIPLEYPGLLRPDVERFFNNPPRKPIVVVGRNPPPEEPKPSEPKKEEHISSASSFTLTIIILVGICFLIINLVSFFFVWYQKKKLKKEMEMNARYRRESGVSIPELESRYAKKEPEKNEVKSILKSRDGSYEPVKVKSEKGGKWLGMYRQGSSSTMTMDPHTKVTEWITNEIVHRCSPHFLRKSKNSEKYSDIDRASTATTSKLAKTGQVKAKKVSVAVDATPSARSASVLKQIPIELTKSLDDGSRRLGGRPGRPVLQRSYAIDDDVDPLRPSHSHSNSDPVQSPPGPEPEQGTSHKSHRDINVTCREELPESTLTPEEALDNIKRRNFPKVLPDFPDSESENDKRAVLTKRMSMPQSPVEERSGEGGKRVPPPPPPRVSTLGRRSHRPLAHEDPSSPSPSPSSASRPVRDAPLPGVVRKHEPKVIIKPTLADPKLKKEVNPLIPRVKHHTVDVENCERAEPEEPKRRNPRPERPPGQGVGAALTVHPVKRQPPPLEASNSSVSTVDTVRENEPE